MDRWKNPAAWCALLYAVAAGVAMIWDFPPHSIGDKATAIAQLIFAQAGALLFGAGLAKPPAASLEVPK